MNFKTCFKCGLKKSLKNFYKHKKMSDGYLGKCKDCTKKDTLKNRNDNIEYYKEYDRKRANLPHRIKLRKQVSRRWKSDQRLKKITTERHKKWREKNSIKYGANTLVNNAMRDGRLIKQPCEVCGKEKVEAHHDDYNFPLTVRWLCKKHHMDHHKAEREVNRNFYTPNHHPRPA